LALARDALERIVVGLHVKDPAGIAISLGPLATGSLELRSISDGTFTMTVMRVLVG
jgi:hypothetical protein